MKRYLPKKAQITRSWIVYPPNYLPGAGYFYIPFLKDAWNKACSLGEGAELVERVEQVYRDGAWSSCCGKIYTVEKQK